MSGSVLYINLHSLQIHWFGCQIAEWENIYQISQVTPVVVNVEFALLYLVFLRIISYYNSFTIVVSMDWGVKLTMSILAVHAYLHIDYNWVVSFNIWFVYDRHNTSLCKQFVFISNIYNVWLDNIGKVNRFLKRHCQLTPSCQHLITYLGNRIVREIKMLVNWLLVSLIQNCLV